jgi:hypothetical protein
MQHPLKINSQGKVVKYHLPLLGIDYGISDLKIDPDINDPLLWRISYNAALKYPITYITLDFQI